MKYFISYIYPAKNSIGVGNIECEWQKINSIEEIRKIEKEIANNIDENWARITNWREF